MEEIRRKAKAEVVDRLAVKIEMEWKIGRIGIGTVGTKRPSDLSHHLLRPILLRQHRRPTLLLPVVHRSTIAKHGNGIRALLLRRQLHLLRVVVQSVVVVYLIQSLVRR